MREVKVLDLRDELGGQTRWTTAAACEAVLASLYAEGWRYRATLTRGVLLLEKAREA